MNTVNESILHDMKTPLSIMYTYISELEHCLDYDADYIKMISVIKKYWYRIMKMVNDATDYGRLKNGSMTPAFKNLDMVYIVRELVNSTRALSDRKGIRLVFASDMDYCVMAADKYIIERILLNILSNAIKFTGKSGIIEVCISSAGGMFNIKVKDDGIGIKGDSLECVFDKYYTVKSELNKNGSGLGLFIVKELITLLGGDISIKSTIGTEVMISIPIVVISESTEDTLQYTNFFSDNIVQVELSDDY